MHRLAAKRTGDFDSRIGRFVGRQMIGQQPPGQPIPQIARPVFTLFKGNQPVLAIVAQHLVKRLTGLIHKRRTPPPKFFASDSRHDRSSMIQFLPFRTPRPYYPTGPRRSNGRTPAFSIPFAKYLDSTENADITGPNN
jgi:hypothetical protein